MQTFCIQNYKNLKYKSSAIKLEIQVKCKKSKFNTLIICFLFFVKFYFSVSYKKKLTIKFVALLTAWCWKLIYETFNAVSDSMSSVSEATLPS